MDLSDRGGLMGGTTSRRRFLQGGCAGLAAARFAPGWSGPCRTAPPVPDRSVILLLLVGGPSQLETFDPKPDAPAEVRGPFGSIATRVPGIRVSEHLPRLASRMDRVALVRSVRHDAAPIHETGLQLLQTGRLCQSGVEHPHLGSVLARLRPARGSAPPSIILGGPLESTGVNIARGQSAGYLGVDADPVFLDNDGTAIAGARASGRDRAVYGDSAFGRDCRAAVRLVEAGARAVTVNMCRSVFRRPSWDVHGSSPFSTFDDYARDPAAELRSRLRRGAGRPRTHRTAGLDARGRGGRARTLAPDQRDGRAGPLAAGLEHRPGRRRNPRRPGRRGQRRPRRRAC